MSDTFDFYDEPADLAKTLPVDLLTEFYETPIPFTKWLALDLARLQGAGPSLFHARTIFEPCVGNGAIIDGFEAAMCAQQSGWITADLDPRWPADVHGDATDCGLWEHVQSIRGPIDWTVTNPPFEPCLDILANALHYSRVGVAMHLRASIHEVLKTGPRRTFMATHPPTGLLWLPRYGYQRSKTTGKWATDSVCAIWCIWLKAWWTGGQFIRYAPEWVLDDLETSTKAYRRRMDAVMAERRGGS